MRWLETIVAAKVVLEKIVLWKIVVQKRENPRTFFRGGGFFETRVVSRSTLSRTCDGGNKDDDKNERRERDVQDSGIDARGLRDERMSPRRTVCGGVLRELDAALRHEPREPCGFKECQVCAC